MTNEFEKAYQEYEKIQKENINDTMIYCIGCAKASLGVFDSNNVNNKELIKEIAMSVYDEWLHTDYMQISKISDILVEHWKEYNEQDNFNIYDYDEVF